MCIRDSARATPAHRRRGSSARGSRWGCSLHPERACRWRRRCCASRHRGRCRCCSRCRRPPHSGGRGGRRPPRPPTPAPGACLRAPPTQKRGATHATASSHRPRTGETRRKNDEEGVHTAGTESHGNTVSCAAPVSSPNNPTMGRSPRAHPGLPTCPSHTPAAPAHPTPPRDANPPRPPAGSTVALAMGGAGLRGGTRPCGGGGVGGIMATGGDGGLSAPPLE